MLNDTEKKNMKVKERQKNKFIRLNNTEVSMLPLVLTMEKMECSCWGVRMGGKKKKVKR